ncbi:Flp family type IVb pilin [Qipengyuania vesicularis]|uniref:Flp family type IVb pilin n=1 Tax=Qipengyuania vesicularis TaxID=2867232 RepID=UPI001C86D7DC|nr:Flp family type IVb pilin [Qipengyuania vesicularis]MBX7526540.1 Flp family type IVb pilin [Qipengyuania vesicularis]
MVRFLKSLGRDDQGATAVEYGLIVALIFLAMIGGVQTFGNTAISMWNNISTTVASVRP